MIQSSVQQITIKMVWSADSVHSTWLCHIWIYGQFAMVGVDKVWATTIREYGYPFARILEQTKTTKKRIPSWKLDIHIVISNDYWNQPCAWPYQTRTETERQKWQVFFSILWQCRDELYRTHDIFLCISLVITWSQLSTSMLADLC